MLKFASKTLLAVLVVASTITAIPSAASADGFSFGFGFGNGGGRWQHRDDGPGMFPGSRYEHGGYRVDRRRAGCSEWEAIDTARAYGVRAPRIVKFGRKVVVEGRRYHSYVRLVMINAPGCPVIGR
jgi:hypothetical protein